MDLEEVVDLKLQMHLQTDSTLYTELVTPLALILMIVSAKFIALT